MPDNTSHIDRAYGPIEPESETAERKKSWDSDCLKDLAALANTRGGTLWIGIDDDGRIVGWTGDGREQERVACQISDTLHCLPRALTVQQRDGLQLLVIRMGRAAAPVAVRGRYYQRVGNSTREVPSSDLARFLLERTGQTWNELPSGLALDEVSEKTVADFRVLARERLPDIAPSDTTSLILNKLQLTLSDGRLNRAGVLLFGKNPQRLVRSANVQVGRFSDEATILDEKTVSGNLFAQIDQTMQAVRGYLLVRYEIPTSPAGRGNIEDLQRREIWEFPYDAVREAVLNALIHRDYAATGSAQIRVYTNRLVISNPGGLPEGLTVGDLLKEHGSFPRNPAIAQTVYFTRMIEKWGTGTLRMRNACAKEGAPPPEFESRTNEFVVTFRKSRAISVRDLRRRDEEDRVLALVAARADGVTRRDIVDILDCPPMTAAYVIARLKHRGLLIQIGSRRWARYYLAQP